MSTKGQLEAFKWILEAVKIAASSASEAIVVQKYEGCYQCVEVIKTQKFVACLEEATVTIQEQIDKF